MRHRVDRQLILPLLVVGALLPWFFRIDLASIVEPTPNSIMCYQIPGTITKDGKPIPGGFDIDASDASYVASAYAK